MESCFEEKFFIVCNDCMGWMVQETSYIGVEIYSACPN